jgi:hypothetical protein
MFNRSLSRAQDTSDEEDSNAIPNVYDTQEPEYHFEGFTIEFSEKVMLTPVVINQVTVKQITAQ